jgi:CDP-diacylglycerol--serine O-phosphatidyltransferase
MSHREKMFAVLPTMLTLGNAFCGFAAITYAAKVGPEPAEGGGAHLLTAALCIFAGMLFDALDGRAARWANQTSEFGAQLDSLCDAISFGVAPAFLMIQFCHFYESIHKNGLYHGRVLWMIGALFAVCAILRLARFNVETDEDDSHDSFSGLPSPAAAGAVASFPIAKRGIDKLIAANGSPLSSFASDWIEPVAHNLLPLITLAAACLMMSRIRYSHVFNQVFTGRRNRAHVIQIVFTIAVVFMVQEMAVPLLFCYFAFASPLRAAWGRAVSPKTRESQAS